MSRIHRPPFKIGDIVTPRDYSPVVRNKKLNPNKKYEIVEVRGDGSRRVRQSLCLKGVVGYFHAGGFIGEDDKVRPEKYQQPPLKVGDKVMAKTPSRSKGLGLEPGLYYKVTKTNGHDALRAGQYVRLAGKGDRFFVATSFFTEAEKKQ